MKHLSTLESLDYILIEIDEANPDIEPWQIVKNLTTKAAVISYKGNWANIHLILHKLLDDKYANVALIQTTHVDAAGKSDCVMSERYSITFIGRIFIANGGYVGEYARNNEDKIKIDAATTYQREQADTLNRLTGRILIVTGIAAIYYSLEIIKFVYSAFHH